MTTVRKIEHTLDYQIKIGNEAKLIATFDLLKQEALKKKLLLMAIGTEVGYFAVVKVGQPCGNPFLFTSEKLTELNDFIESYGNGEL